MADHEGYLEKKGGIRKNWLRRRFVLEGAELAYFDNDGDKKGSINMFEASSIRKSTCPTAKGHEMEIETADRTWRFRAASEDELEAWLHALSASVQSAAATQGMTPQERLHAVGLVYRLPDYGVPWIGEPPRKSYESSPPVKAKPGQVYGLHGSIRKLKVCMGWWIKGHKPWKEQKGVHAGAALLDEAGNMIDFCDFHKRKSACGGVSWDPNSPPPKPHEIHTRHPPPECENPEMWRQMDYAAQKAQRKMEKRAAKHWAKKGDDEAIKIKFAKLNPAVHYVVPVVTIIKQKYAWHLDRKKSVRKLKMRLVHGTKEDRYVKTHIPHDEECRASMLEMNLNKWDQDLDSTMSSSSNSSDSGSGQTHRESTQKESPRFLIDGDDAGCESYIMGVIARKGAFWACRCGGFKAAGRSLTAVGANPANIYPAINGMAPTWNETQFRRVHVQVLGARNLLARDKPLFGGGGSSDPYMKLKYKKVNTIRSGVIEKTCNPTWDGLPVVDMRVVDPAGFKAMIITIWDSDTLGDDFIGALKLRPGMFFGGIQPRQHDLWLPLAPDRNHPHVDVPTYANNKTHSFLHADTCRFYPDKLRAAHSSEKHRKDDSACG